MMNAPDSRTLEEQIARALHENPISFVPDSREIQQLDQELPEAWTQILEIEQEYTPEELRLLLDAELEIPEGDILTNAQQALDELHQEGIIDIEIIIQETSKAPDISIEHHQEIDLDR